MLFTQPLYFLFFITVFALYWRMRSHARRKLLRLIASYTFYGAWDPRFLALICVSTAIDYVVGRRLDATSEPASRKALLWISVAANLGILGFFKYYDFFVQSGADLFGLTDVRTLKLILPVGISFFTFQSMSYTIDIYRRRLNAIDSFTDFALFVSFFPQLVAGPIVRAATFLPQLRTEKRFARVPVQSLLTLFLIGFIKKACISDNIAPIIDPVFANPHLYDVLSIWIAVIFYAVQIYCDFSGYTDMAIASAGLLGYDLTRNFAFPYFAANIAEFWRRWHISLSTWLRDYLYISLGGNRGGTAKTYRNLMLTMVLGGLWHGAAWHFIIWGALHGIALTVHRWTRERGILPSIWTPLRIAATFYWVCLAWIFFRADTMQHAWHLARAFVTFQSAGDTSLDARLLLWLIPASAAHWIAYRHDVILWVRRVPDWAFSAGLAIAAVAALMFVPTDVQPFIYFQF